MLYPEHAPVTKETMRSFLKLSVAFGVVFTIVLLAVKGPSWTVAILAVSTVGLIVEVLRGSPQ